MSMGAASSAPVPTRRPLRPKWKRPGGGSVFYGSTRTYLPILALHGLEDLGAKLHRMSVEGQWDRMGAEISDDTVRIFAACGTYDTLATAVEARFGGLADSIDLHFPAATPMGLIKELVTDIRRIPHTFAGFNTNW
jgi:hypothetical protein